jgi:hypothetical protein
MLVTHEELMKKAAPAGRTRLVKSLLVFCREGFFHVLDANIKYYLHYLFPDSTFRQRR